MRQTFVNLFCLIIDLVETFTGSVASEDSLFENSPSSASYDADSLPNSSSPVQGSQNDNSFHNFSLQFSPNAQRQFPQNVYANVPQQSYAYPCYQVQQPSPNREQFVQRPQQNLSGTSRNLFFGNAVQPAQPVTARDVLSNAVQPVSQNFSSNAGQAAQPVTARDVLSNVVQPVLQNFSSNTVQPGNFSNTVQPVSQNFSSNAGQPVSQNFSSHAVQPAAPATARDVLPSLQLTPNATIPPPRMAPSPAAARIAAQQQHHVMRTISKRTVSPASHYASSVSTTANDLSTFSDSDASSSRNSGPVDVSKIFCFDGPSDRDLIRTYIHKELDILKRLHDMVSSSPPDDFLSPRDKALIINRIAARAVNETMI